MTWSISSLPNSTSFKSSGTVANATASVANQQSSVTKPKTADDFAKLTFSGQAKHTGLASVNAGLDANVTNRTVKTKPVQTNTDTGQQAISTDKKRQIMSNLQRDLETRAASGSGSDSKKAAMFEVAKTLKDIDLKATSDKEIDKLFSQVQERMNASAPNRAYQSVASQFNALPNYMNLLG